MKGRFVHQFTPAGAAIYAATLLVGIGLIFSRKTAFWSRVPGIADWHVEHHVYNFALSFQLTVMIGALWLLMGVRFGHVLALVAVVAVANVIYELLIPILNVRDPLDALYGLVGCSAAILVLLAFRRRGLTAVKP